MVSKPRLIMELVISYLFEIESKRLLTSFLFILFVTYSSSDD